jgi:hypothetical protein
MGTQREAGGSAREQELVATVAFVSALDESGASEAPSLNGTMYAPSKGRRALFVERKARASSLRLH